MRGHTLRSTKVDEDMVLLGGIEERNSLSGNWIASLDREVIKKSGYNGEAYVRNNKDRVIPWEVVRKD
jgi:hypothetical protein